MQPHSAAGGSILAREDMVSCDLLASQQSALASLMEAGSSVAEVPKAEKEEKEILPAVFPGDSVYVKVFRRKWNVPRREETYEVVQATSTAVQVKGSPTRYHLETLHHGTKEQG
ncbi:uncharacterized protein LOC121634675 isoform X1 [Lates japonicus]